MANNKLAIILDKALTEATRKISEDSDMVITDDRKTIYVGKHKIAKEDNGYAIYSKKTLLVDSIFLLESAVYITERIIAKRENRINEIIKYDKEYAKHRTDMYNFTSVLGSKNARIIIDRYDEASYRAKQARKMLRRQRYTLNQTK